MNSGEVALRDALRGLDISVVLRQFDLFVNINKNGSLADGITKIPLAQTSSAFPPNPPTTLTSPTSCAGQYLGSILLAA